MKRNLPLIGILFLFILSACGKGREASIEKIKDLELRLANEKNPDQQGPLVYDLEILYNDFANRFPDDSLSATYLYKAFEQNLRLNWYDRAIKSAEVLIKKFPNSSKTPEVMFNMAFIYDDKLNDDAKAGEIYNEFLKLYPDHALSADAKYSILFLGLTPEETLKKVEEMSMQKDSASAANSAPNPQ